ncbi:unnamed protein product [Auanema sp. JU1783]|nr:unnamed protein product [Auanema sp. JU1783]
MTSYPMYDRDFFMEPCYIPSFNTGPTVAGTSTTAVSAIHNHYDFYQSNGVVPVPPAVQDGINPYGWRPDWNRPPSNEWLAPTAFHNPAPAVVDQMPSYNHMEPIPGTAIEIKAPTCRSRESTSNKAFRCQLCGKYFSQAANLTAHKRVHTGEKPFECSICNRPFSQSSSLVTHRRTHTGERPYPCKHCDKAFTDSSTLTKHLRTHTGQKPYSCSTCHMRFTQSGNLHRHMKTHRN